MPGIYDLPNYLKPADATVLRELLSQASNTLPLRVTINGINSTEITLALIAVNLARQLYDLQGRQVTTPAVLQPHRPTHKQREPGIRLSRVDLDGSRLWQASPEPEYIDLED